MKNNLLSLTLSQEQFKNQKRNIFHTKDYNQWFKKRYPNKVQEKYLYFPEEYQMQLEMKKIFEAFDYNNSKTLDLIEMHKMFRHFGFSVTYLELKEIYDIIDQTKDEALDYNEFREFLMNGKINPRFRQIMSRLSCEPEEINHSYEIDKPAYYPRTIGAMITYLQYMMNREQQVKKCKESNISLKEQYSNLNTLIMIQEKKSVADEAFQQQQRINNFNDFLYKQIPKKAQLKKIDPINFKQIVENAQQAAKKNLIQRQSSIIMDEKVNHLPKKLPKQMILKKQQKFSTQHNQLLKRKMRQTFGFSNQSTQFFLPHHNNSMKKMVSESEVTIDSQLKTTYQYESHQEGRLEEILEDKSNQFISNKLKQNTQIRGIKKSELTYLSGSLKNGQKKAINLCSSSLPLITK